MRRRIRGGFQNDAAEKIWNDHLGNNAFVRHRDQCAICLDAYRTRSATPTVGWCPVGASVADEGAAEHRVQCAACRGAYRAWIAAQPPPAWCAEGERVFSQMLDEVLAEVDEALTQGN